MIWSIVVWVFLQVAALVAVLVVIDPYTHAHGDHPPQPLGGSDANKLLVLLLDGFRWDSVPTSSRGFQRLYENGIHAKSMQPCFPSVSFTNYYSIMTGLYPESHGMINNKIYDAEHNKTFTMDLNRPEDHEPFWWDGGEPIWITASRNNKKVLMYRWPGCEMTIRGQTLPLGHCMPLGSSNMTILDLEENVMAALTGLADDEADLAGIYYTEPDEVQHRHGPDSEEAKKAILDIDDVIFKMQAKMESLTMLSDGKTPLSQRLNVIVVSDHGMTSVSHDRVVNLTTLINMSDIDRILHISPLSIWPKEGRTEAVYNRLEDVSHTSVYKRENIPEHWHYKKNDRVSPISVVADLGYVILTPERPEFPSFGKNVLKGFHGFDNQQQDMQAIFAARGPNFKKNLTIGAFPNVELYQVMCSILDVPASVHNGSWVVAMPMLRGLHRPHDQHRSLVMTVVGALLIVILLSAIVCGAYYFKQNIGPKYGHIPNDDPEL